MPTSLGAKRRAARPNFGYPYLRQYIPIKSPASTEYASTFLDVISEVEGFKRLLSQLQFMILGMSRGVIVMISQLMLIKDVDKD
jgi:hypothetical protein